MLRIGDLVTARHWKHHQIAIVLDNSRAREADMGIVRVAMIDNPDYQFDQLLEDMEKIA